MFDSAGNGADGGAGIVRVVGQAVHFAEEFFVGPGRAVFAIAGVETEVLRIFEGDAGWGFGVEGLGRLRPDADADGGVGAAASVVKITADPTVTFDFVFVAGSLPDFG